MRMKEKHEKKERRERPRQDLVLLHDYALVRQESLNTIHIIHIM